jgi:hypothetical protein
VSILPNFLIETYAAKKEPSVLYPDWVYSVELVALVRRGRTPSAATRELLKEVRLACRALGGKVARSSG